MVVQKKISSLKQFTVKETRSTAVKELRGNKEDFSTVRDRKRSNFFFFKELSRKRIHAWNKKNV